MSGSSRSHRPGGTVPALQVGELAPDLELPAVTGERRHRVRLSEYRGKKNVVLAFHPLDWTPT
jgi:peroxiredoxin